MEYTATQESLCNNNASINVLQGQIQMVCNIIYNQPPPPGMIPFLQQQQGQDP
jgi:hypothetical protein